MKRTILAVALLAAFGSLQAATAQDAYPNRLIKLIVPFAAGGNTDVVGRVTAAHMQKALKANVVVENRAGAGGINGTDVVAKAAPDGYTLCLCGIGPITVAPATEKLPYDPLKDLAPISLVNTNPLILIVNPKVEAKSGAELAALSKSTPGGLSYGTVGSGGLMQFAAEIFRVKTDSKFTSVPYRGGALATGAVVSGEVQLAFSNMSDAMAQMAAGHRAGARHHHRQTQPADARHSDADGARPGRLPGRVLECPVRAGRHAQADRRSPGRGDGGDGEGRDPPKTHGRYRIDRRRQLAQRFQQDAARGNRSMGQGAQGDRAREIAGRSRIPLGPLPPGGGVGMYGSGVGESARSG